MTSDNHHYQIILQALQHLTEQQSLQPGLEELAQHCGLSSSHLQRLFTRYVGISPKQFLLQLNRQTLQQHLAQGASLLNASENSGLSSPSRGYELMIKWEALTPGEWKSKGDKLSFVTGIIQTPYGPCWMACTDRGIHELQFMAETDRQNALTFEQTLQKRWPKATIDQDNKTIESYAGTVFGETANELTLQPSGSPFQLKVWEALLKIPAGHIASYGQIAALIGKPAASRAVGTAIAANRIALLIPCHRVIQQLGAIGNYRWGSDRKHWLLAQELSQQTT